eukprot:TRINITY_DN2474_c0_g1_i10.p1 TRINITY_DN2474_c0_g1~~TRINITY_DN2474_c0_g1_i10.p1  ORF type:complete len:117 (+),score=21.70 TRINITY_DN2474_c0_g1_i10:53-403(+)
MEVQSSWHCPSSISFPLHNGFEVFTSSGFLIARQGMAPLSTYSKSLAPVIRRRVGAVVQSSCRMTTGSGRVLSEEEKAAENVYIKKMEAEKIEKLKKKQEGEVKKADTEQKVAEKK